MDFIHALRDVLKLEDTAWLLSTGSTEQGHGKFNPDGKTHKERFGVDTSETPGVHGDYYVSKHAVGDNVNLYDKNGNRFLGPEILGAEPSANPSDDEDAASYTMAAPLLLALGREKGIIPQPEVKPLPAKPSVKPKPEPVKVSSPVEVLHAELVSELKRILARAEEVQLPPAGGGIPAQGLRAVIHDLRAALNLPA